ncbi:GNAT family N-acetyltransferase [Paracoccus sp. p3-h83]|uniref:GNAT family N-acetyltransferase n=1 Tax=Paracoccus sp. p3-h83 TaxID=3342805 RepID=UPI0035B77DCA
MGFHLRAFEPGDVAALTEMVNMPGVIHGTLQRPFQSLADRQRRNEAFQALVQIAAVDGDDRLVGHLSLTGNANPRRAHAADLGMAVRDDWVRRGVGSALLAAAVVQARDWLGLRRLELTVFADNGPAIALYRKQGFVEEGRFHGWALRAGRYEDVIAMAITLN